MHAVPVAAFDPAPTTADQELERYARRLLQLRRWTQARTALHQLAVRSPHTARVRALLAYARGHEAAELGERDRAASEWARALLFDPSFDDARASLATARGRGGWFSRLWRR